MESHKYYKGTEQECIDYNATVTEQENYSGSTTHWADPIYLESNWYIPKHDKYPSSMEEVDSIPVPPEDL